MRPKLGMPNPGDPIDKNLYDLPPEELKHLSYKRRREIHEIRLRPHPYEFVLYYDV